jgi:hypothetical protein
MKRKNDPNKNLELQEFKRNRLGIDPSLPEEQRIGKPVYCTPCNPAKPHNISAHTWPTPTELRTQGFGQPSKNHSFRTEATFEHTLIYLFKSCCLDTASISALSGAHPLIGHLHKTIRMLEHYNFQSLREYNPDWAKQTSIQESKVRAGLACLLHYDGRVSDVMRFAGNNYTGAHRNIKERVKRLQGLVDDDLLERYITIMTTGAPTKFNAESSAENTRLYWRKGNHSSIQPALEQVQKTMNKEERNNHVLALPNWTYRFLPDCFITPQHNLVKPGKADRLIFDASLKHDAFAVPVNGMTSTHEGIELDCIFGDTFKKVLTRIWNLRLTYPNHDIIIHANDVKSCFRQIKHHPDVVGAFSYIIAAFLYIQCGLAFGSDFSPQAWEPCRRMAEQLAEKLCQDDSLVIKHKQYLDQLQWGKKLGKARNIVPATPCVKHQGVLDADGKPTNTPHFYFVDDGVFAEIFEPDRCRSCGQ